MPIFQVARIWLETNVHPAAPWALLTIGIFLAVYATRKLAPALWVWFDKITPDGMISHVVQGLPSVLGGALLTVLLTGGDFAESWKGALAGALAPVIHLIMKAAPVPYQGAVAAVAKKIGISALLILVLFLPGCAALQAAVEVADDVAKIAQTLCLLDQAKRHAVRALTVQELCQTADQLAPYLDEAKALQERPRAMAVCR